MKRSDVLYILRQIVSEYKLHFGETKGELSTWPIDDDILLKNKKIEKICISSAPEPIQKNKYWYKTLKHLETESYIKSKNGRYFLTNTGYEKGSQTYFESVVTYLNLNPGLAIIISIFALFISVIALFN